MGTCGVGENVRLSPDFADRKKTPPGGIGQQSGELPPGPDQIDTSSQGTRELGRAFEALFQMISLHSSAKVQPRLNFHVN